MNKDYENKYHQLEDSHFWFKSRRNFIIQLLKNENRNSRILDIGCSSGLLLMDLERHSFNKQNLFGIDISEKAIQNCKINGLSNCFVMSGESITLKEKFDIIIASDCLEHIKNDADAIKNWKQQLKIDGKLYVFVPAFKSLWSHHDVVNMHYRRYKKSQLTNLLKSNKLDLIASGYWNFTLFTPLYIFRSLSRLVTTKSDNKSNGDLNKIGILNSPLLGLLNLENRILKYLKFPFGISTYVIAKKQ
jgi:2-polyprenyl-3-methyl-5-hydroxy-6-metoxy-1,4-benzoquinol methylase